MESSSGTDSPAPATPLPYEQQPTLAHLVNIQVEDNHDEAKLGAQYIMNTELLYESTHHAAMHTLQYCFGCLTCDIRAIAFHMYTMYLLFARRLLPDRGLREAAV